MSLHDRINNLFERFKLTGSDDTGPLQKVKGMGRGSRLFGGQALVNRFQQAGFSSRPSAGEGVVICLNGNPDQALVIVLDNPAKRPTGLEPGESVQYNEFGDFLKIDKDGQAHLYCKTVFLEASVQVIVKAPAVHLGDVGGQPVAVLGSVDSNGDHITGGCAAKVFAV